MAIGPKLKIDLHIEDVQRAHMHGTHRKDMIVLHETVSPNYRGLGDIQQVSEYLGTHDYGIHGITDGDGNIAWALGLGHAVFWHTASSGRKGDGLINSRAIGIEQVSRVMLDYRTREEQRLAWLKLDAELKATAKLIAAAARAHKIPVQYSNGRNPGVTTHWLVTMTFEVPGGHVDGWPTDNGGYYPLGLVIKRARAYYKMGYHF